MTEPRGFEEIARDLYGRRPGEFTAARDALAREVRAAGDAELAAALLRLRRPTLAAWLANVLVRELPRAVDHLIEIGAQLRAAQAALDAAELRRLSSERHDVVEELSRSARELAATRGERVGDSSIRELAETLEAASFDPEIADRVRSGRLTSALSYSGMGFPPDAVGGSSAGPRPAAAGRGKTPEPPEPPEAPEPPGATTRAKAGKDATPTEGARAAREAREAVRAARRAAGLAAAALSAAERSAEHERESLTAAEMELARRREAAGKAEREVKRARADRDAAQREVRRTERLLRSATKRAK